MRGTISCPVDVEVIRVPSQTATCDTAGAMKSKLPALSPFEYASRLSAEMWAGSPCDVDRSIYHFIFCYLISSTNLPHTMQLTHLWLLRSAYGCELWMWQDAWKPVSIVWNRGVSCEGPLSCSGGDKGDSKTGRIVSHISILLFEWISFWWSIAAFLVEICPVEFGCHWRSRQWCAWPRDNFFLPAPGCHHPSADHYRAWDYFLLDAGYQCFSIRWVIRFPVSRWVLFPTWDINYWVFRGVRANIVYIE